MPFEASHPDEPDLHHELRDALNAGIQNTNFFVWISVYPTGWGKSFSYLPRIVEAVEEWLGALDPDQARPWDKVGGEIEIVDPAADVRLRAIPKKPEARGTRSGLVVGNPEPILTGWH
jgi:hypothetical protein